jgi:hypothetical protein
MKKQEHEGELPLPSGAKDKNAWKFASTFSIKLHVVSQRDRFKPVTEEALPYTFAVF